MIRLTCSTLLYAALLLAVPACESGKLAVTKVEPALGPLEGGHVTIRGNGFQSKGPVGVTVYFGERKGRVVEVEDDEIAVRAPGGKSGEKVDIRLVFDDSREFVYKGGYEYRDVNAGFDVTSLTRK